jgi:hypothetical protein
LSRQPLFGFDGTNHTVVYKINAFLLRVRNEKAAHA